MEKLQWKKIEFLLKLMWLICAMTEVRKKKTRQALLESISLWFAHQKTQDIRISHSAAMAAYPSLLSSILQSPCTYLRWRSFVHSRPWMEWTLKCFVLFCSPLPGPLSPLLFRQTITQWLWHLKLLQTATWFVGSNYDYSSFIKWSLRWYTMKSIIEV